MAIVHKHLIIRANIKASPVDVYAVKQDLCDLVKMIDMKLLGAYDQPAGDYRNPVASYCLDPENRGMSGFALIETSSIMLHAWDDRNPNLLELDVYTCATLDFSKVMRWLRRYDPVDLTYMIIDRADALSVLEKGRVAFAKNHFDIYQE